jgi:hypothetical protein
MPKKIITTILIATALCSLSACSKGKDESSQANTQAAQQEDNSSDETAANVITDNDNTVPADLDDAENYNIDELVYSNDSILHWYSIDENGELVPHSENTEPDDSGNELLDKFVEEGMIFDGMAILDFTKDVVNDGVAANESGLYEVFHREATVNFSASFTDLLNQEEEDTQILILEAIADSFKDTYGVDIVDIKCDGQPVITDCLNYDNTVNEAREAFKVDEPDYSVIEECYEEY